jgi:hypothetical protein
MGRRLTPDDRNNKKKDGKRCVTRKPSRYGEYGANHDDMLNI